MGAVRACSAEVTLDHCPKEKRDARLPSANLVDIEVHSLIGPENVLPSHCNVNEAEKVSAVQKIAFQRDETVTRNKMRRM
jgi:hypothetical protein